MIEPIRYRPPDTPPPGILFAEDFDLPNVAAAPADAPPPEPPPPVFSEEDLAASRAEGFAAGRAAAEAAAEARRAEATLRLLETIAAEIGGARAEARCVAESGLDALGRTACAALAALFPAACAHLDAGEVAAFVRDVLASFATPPDLRLSVAPDRIEEVRAALAGLDPSALDRVTLLAQPGLDPSDARVAWTEPADSPGGHPSHGHAARRGRQVREAVTAALARFGLLPEAMPPEPRPRRAEPPFLPPPFLQPRFAASQPEPAPTPNEMTREPMAHLDD